MNQQNPLGPAFDRQPHYAGTVHATPTRAPIKPFSPDATILNIGLDMAVKSFNAKDWSKIQTYVDDANSDDPLRQRNGLSALHGVALFMSDVLIRTHNSKWAVIKGNIPTRDEIAYAFKTDLRTFNTIVNGLVKATNTVMDAVPGLKAGLVNKEADKRDAQPVSVRIVEMPMRKTTTEIMRDQAGDIATSIQVESDV